MINFFTNLLLLFLSTFTNSPYLSQTNPPHYGKIVYQKDHHDQIGLVMKQVDQTVLVWWQDWTEYHPFDHGRPYFHKMENLILADDSTLSSTIYRQTNNSVPETMVIGKYVCSKVLNCHECFIINSYWKYHWLLQIDHRGGELLDVSHFNKHGLYGCSDIYRPDDPCFKTDIINDGRRCVIKGCCKIALEDPVPSYCNC